MMLITYILNSQTCTVEVTYASALNIIAILVHADIEITLIESKD